MLKLRIADSGTQVSLRISAAPEKLIRIRVGMALFVSLIIPSRQFITILYILSHLSRFDVFIMVREGGIKKYKKIFLQKEQLTIQIANG